MACRLSRLALLWHRVALVRDLPKINHMGNYSAGYSGARTEESTL